MKKVSLLSMLLVVCFVAGAFAQVTPIKDIQFSEAENGDSPLVGQIVTISGIVTVESWATGGSRYFVQDANEAWSGIMMYDPPNDAAEGDSVTLTGKVTEYYGLTEITDVTEFRIDKEGVFGITPMKVTTVDLGTGGANAESYEGCLIQVENVTITNPDLGYGEWEVNDGSGPVVVDDMCKFYFDPTKYGSCQSITGVMDWSYSARKIIPRLAFDIVEEGPYTRIQRIQQVRYSDLMKAGLDETSDTSYFDGDTVSVRGVVTMPSGLSYAGAGVKFIFGDPAGGPWSAILSYNADSTAYPSLYEGDEIEMTGYIGEYSTGPSNMTEFWILSPINILSVGNPVPEPDSIATGDIRWPTTAEQWGNVLVKVGNATVTNITRQYELFAVDDGSGSLLVDDDSDSLIGFPDPSLGTIAESIRGWVYHHYGSYADSTAYVLCPLYRSDIIWGAGPPTIRNSMRAIGAPKSADAVNVTTTIETNLNMSSVKIMYKVGEGDYSEVLMTDTGELNFTGEIPAQASDSFVSYYILAEDENGQVSTDPSLINKANYCYVVKDDGLDIADLQWTPWELADSPFNGYEVEVTGIVTADTVFYNKYGAYPIQDYEGAWNGVFVFGALPAYFPGDNIKVKGVCSDYNPDWGFKWDNNTVILVEEAELLSSGNDVPVPMAVSTGDLGGDAAESFEGTLVKIENITLTRINSYDVTVDDGSGPVLLDGDAFVGADQNPNPYFFIDRDNTQLIVYGDTVQIGETMGFAQGVYLFSFGTYKIEIRNLGDIGTVTGVNKDFMATPLTYALDQNFPNPFNPETRIYFEVPQQHNIQLVIYNMMGQQIRTLVDEAYSAGRHVVNWDGRDNGGIKVPSGMYVYRIKAGDYIDHKKMMLIK